MTVQVFQTKEGRTKFYKSTAWCGVNGVRKKALKRDNFECQWCKRDGLVTTSEMGVLEVDHIIELQHGLMRDALDINNLRTLCNYHHNVRHNRFNGKEKKENKWNDECWD